METVERILCPTDFSECSVWAVQRAASLARRYGSTLHLLNVRALDRGDLRRTRSHPELAQYVELLEKMARDDLDAVEVDCDVPVERTVMRGEDTLTPIVEHARSVSADLIVAGTHGRTGLARALLGSVAEKLLRRSPVPVLIVGQPAPEDTVFTRIIAPVDFSAAAVDALVDVARFARQNEACVTLTHVLDPKAHPGFYLLDKVAALHAFDELQARAKDAMARVVAQLEIDDVVDEQIVLVGEAAPQIVELAQSRAASLIVVTTRQAGIPRLLPGSVAGRIVRRAGCPVLVLR